MNKENTEKLLKAFPKIYPEIHPLSVNYKPHPFTFDCGDGWFQLLWELSEKINKEIEQAEQEPGAEKWEPIAIQVKEKFGMLHFYIKKATDGIMKAIDEAGENSAVTCELCGEHGVLRTDRDWILTLCDKCNEEANI